jgi:hypothetical protein
MPLIGLLDSKSVPVQIAVLLSSTSSAAYVTVRMLTSFSAEHVVKQEDMEAFNSYSPFKSSLKT